MRKTRIIIIGGGLAGLYAAFQLEKLNIPYVLFEAKNMFGGRIFSEQLKNNDDGQLFHDLGPTWIFPHHYRMQRLVSSLGESLFQQHVLGSILYHENNNTKPQVIEHGQGHLLHRVEGGLFKLILALQSKLSKNNYQLNSQADYVKKVNDVWQVRVKNTNDLTVEMHEAEHLILAMPPRIILKYLTPELWGNEASVKASTKASTKVSAKVLTKAFANVPTWMANQTKFVATYDRPFWREKGLSGQAFSRVGPMIEIHDGSAKDQQGFALFGFVGLSSQALNNMSVEEIKIQCINQLKLLFGDDAQEYSQCYLKCWGNDDYVAVDQDRVEQPVHPSFNQKKYSKECSSLNLYLAGSEFSNVDTGYLEGAIYAADVAINSLKNAFEYDV